MNCEFVRVKRNSIWPRSPSVDNRTNVLSRYMWRRVTRTGSSVGSVRALSLSVYYLMPKLFFVGPAHFWMASFRAAARTRYARFVYPFQSYHILIWMSSRARKHMHPQPMRHTPSICHCCGLRALVLCARPPQASTTFHPKYGLLINHSVPFTYYAIIVLFADRANLNLLLLNCPNASVRYICIGLTLTVRYGQSGALPASHHHIDSVANWSGFEDSTSFRLLVFILLACSTLSP